MSRLRSANAPAHSFVGPEELIALTWHDLDCPANTIRIARPAAGSIQIAPEVSRVFMTLREQRSGQAEHLLLGDEGRESLPLSHLEALISYAAHDGGLQQPADVSPWAVRHTFISYLVRQGIRFSELARIVGTLPAEVTAAYGAILPAGTRHSLDQIK
jgi:succinoglycan biosynthesis transport protein ExoP